MAPSKLRHSHNIVRKINALRHSPGPHIDKTAVPPTLPRSVLCKEPSNATHATALAQSELSIIAASKRHGSNDGCGSYAAAHSVLFIPELLEIILSFLPSV